MDYSKQGSKNRKRRHNPYNERVKNKIGVTASRVIVAAILIGGFALAGTALGIYMGILKNSPKIDVFAMSPQRFTSFIYSSKTGEELLRLDNEEDRVYVNFEDIPEDLVNAFVAIEDERFYSHNGIDIRSIGRAVYLLVTGQDSQGASTITQQLIKNKLGRFDSTIITKLQEQYIAIEFEKHLAEPDMYGSKQGAKEYILEAYLNDINLGRGCYGVQAAVNHYYGKDVSELTIAECATIAAITQNPWGNAPDIHPEKNKVRAQTTLKYMYEDGFITEEEYENAKAEDPYKAIIKGDNLDLDGEGVRYSYYIEAVRNAVRDDLMAKYNLTPAEASNWISDKGLKIYTPQDQNLQKIVDDAMLDPSNFSEADFEIDVEYRLSTQNRLTKETVNHPPQKKTVKTQEEADAFVAESKAALLTSDLEILGERTILTPQPQVGFVLSDYYTGEVLAIAGGRGDKTENLAYNRATMAERQPGSQFKVLASYAPALDLGRITAATVYDDAPYTYSDGVSKPYSPGNWWGSRYEGLSTVRKGIWRSMNILAVRNMLESISIDTAYAYLNNFGFTTLVDGEDRPNGYKTDKVASLPLGGLTDGVTQVELCAAYGTIANGGEYNKPVFYTRVLDHDGNILLENTLNPRQVLKKTTAYILTDMMRDTVRVGTGTNIAFKDVNIPVAGKTGTTTNSYDIGFAGYTPYYASTIWMGYDQPKKIRDDGIHKALWSKIMEEAHRNLPEKDFERPEGIVTATICQDSGKLAGELCGRDPRGGRVRTEIFASGTQPTEYCDVHQEVKVCVTSGQRASYNCPEWETEMRVGIVRAVPVPAATESGSPINLMDRDVDITSLISGPECEYHLNGGVLHDQFGNPYFNPWAANTDTGLDPNAGQVINPDAPLDFQSNFNGAQPTPTPSPFGDTDWGFSDDWATQYTNPTDINPADTNPTDVNPADVNPIDNSGENARTSEDTPPTTDIFEP